jgi:hypothetical protein
MADDERTRCALNSVAWYEAIFRAHGLSSRVANGMWTSRDVAPPYYSNAVTFASTAAAAQTAALRTLRDTLGSPFTVKDSFRRLPLAPFGFRILFDATWIWREASPPPLPCTSGTEWRQVTDAQELAEWEAEWRDRGSPADSRVFLPALLADESVAVLAGRRGRRIVAGCVANRSSDAVGLSNFFADDVDADSLTSEAVGAVLHFAAGAPLVGYARDGALSRMLRVGFRPVESLRVWLFDSR